MVAAAFIGPGTITTASIAGASYGFVLCWALLFSVIATFVLQEMSARLGIVTGRGLSENLRAELGESALGKAAVVLVVAAVGLGNAAYEAGNITGAALGLNAVIGGQMGWWSASVGALAGVLLLTGRYRLIEKTMLALVLTMSVVFLLTMFMTRPSLSAIASGLLVPSLPPGSTLMVLALIGTTVVPYNLFLHASTAAQQWHGVEDTELAIRQSRWDTGFSIGLGGLISLAVMSTAAAAFFGHEDNFSAATMSQQLQPLLGPAASYFFAAGLFSAGLSSAITAPLAAAYAVCGAMGWPTELSDTRFRSIWLSVLLVGTVFATLGTRPLTAILFAQAANGFLLPLCACFLLLVMNRDRLLGGLKNSAVSNLVGTLVVSVAMGLGLFKVAQVLGLVN